MVETLGASSRGGDSQKRILIVPNERAFRGLLRDFVQSLGCLSAEADSAPRALDLLRKTHLPIVVSDSVRPEMDGLELLQIIKKRYPDVDVLIITGHESDYSLKKIAQAGAIDLLAGEACVCLELARIPADFVSAHTQSCFTAKATPPRMSN